MNFDRQWNFYRDMVSERLTEIFEENQTLQKSVYDAMGYSVLAGGKRLRPVLTLAAADMLSGNLSDALRFAVAIECIHTYSLIHDDLPCMDDDDLRRGRSTCHKKFGEATALLAGDGLLTFAFQYMTDFSAFENCSPETVLRIVNNFALNSGCEGMIGGQVVDLESEGKSDIAEEILTYMHNRKTGALIKAALFAGAACANATDEQLLAISKYASCIGLAFQIQDDILDYTGDESVLGKPVGSDEENNKTTYVKLLRIDGARKRAEELTQDAISALDVFDEKAGFLKEVARFLMKRNS